MAGWTEVKVERGELVELAQGRSPGLGTGMGGGLVRATRKGDHWEVTNSSLRMKFVLKEGRHYRITRYGVKRVPPAKEEPNPVIRAVRMLGFSPVLVVRHEAGEGWVHGMFAVDGGGSNTAPSFHVCGDVEWSTVREVCLKARLRGQMTEEYLRE